VRRLALALTTLAACAHAPPRDITPPDEVDDPAARAALAPALAGHRAAFRLAWNGARIGDAREELTAAGDGWRFERRERIEVRRAGVVASARTVVSIDVDEALRARRVVVERWTGSTRTRGEAVRVAGDGWRITFGAGAPRVVDGAAVPSTLVPLLVAAGGARPGRAFAGPVLVEGAGLAVARLELDVSPDRRRTFARIGTAAGDLRAEAALDARGFLAAAGGRAGLSAERVSDAASLDAPFTPPEIVDSSAVRVAGAPAVAGPLRLTIHGVAAPPPRLADLRAQAIRLRGGAWEVSLDEPAAPRAANLLAELRERVHHVAKVLDKDLAVSVLATDEALAAGRGDCTAHALVLASLLRERGYPTRLVTGFVLDDGALRRHRWVLVQVAGDWVPVDPMLDEVPASAAHLALAVHGTGADELAFVDDVAFSGWEGARAEVTGAPAERRAMR
jgi:hypothetical protein